MPRRVVVVCGVTGAGKSAVAAALARDCGFARLSVSSALRDGAAAVYGWERSLLDGATEAARDWLERPDARWSRALCQPGFTPHGAVQQLRAAFPEAVWTQAMLAKLDRTPGDVVFADARSAHDIDALVERGAEVWRVTRAGQPPWLLEAAHRAVLGDGEAKRELDRLLVHEDEYGHLGFAPSVELRNDGTLAELEDAVRRVVLEKLY